MNRNHPSRNRSFSKSEDKIGKKSDNLSEILDADQYQAVQDRGNNLLLIAGAGSGKTRTLTYRAISYLEEIDYENLMIVTFTKKAAREILDRIKANVPEKEQKEMKRSWIGTIHSICWRMLMENGHLVGLEPNWSVLDAADSERVMSISASPFGYSAPNDGKNLLALYSYARNSMTDWKQWVNSQRFPDVKNLNNVGRSIEAYQRRCRRSNRVDFDDLQVLILNLLKRNKDIQRAYQERFKVIMVDEYQDTNQIQAEILKLIAAPCNTITVVGDDSQSIYGFRAATVENILNFERDFKAKKITIGTNYRSTPEIVDLSNESIRNNKRQLFKEIRAANPVGDLPKLFIGRNPDEEARYVVDHIRQYLSRGLKLENMAVLFRATRQSAVLTIALKQACIPFVLVGGEDFFKLEHIKIVLDFIRLLLNPEDSISLGTVLKLLGFQSVITIDQIERQADDKQLSFWGVVQSELGSKTAKYDDETLKWLISFNNTLKQMRAKIDSNNSITPIVTEIVTLLTPILKRKYELRWNEIEEDYAILQSVASPFISLNDFINSISLEQFAEEDPHDSEDRLVLSTIHSVKGLEWDVVFVIGLVEFWFPHKRAIRQMGTDEEERRLFYVSVTRAKKSLFLSTYTQAPNLEGNLMQQTISRFLTELPSNCYYKDTLDAHRKINI